jgi:hypothetical protein
MVRGGVLGIFKNFVISVIFLKGESGSSTGHQTTDDPTYVSNKYLLFILEFT